VLTELNANFAARLPSISSFTMPLLNGVPVMTVIVIVIDVSMFRWVFQLSLYGTEQLLPCDLHFCVEVI
jgi:hypothetical protein